MRTLTRTVLALTVAMLNSLVLVLPASAAQLIEYRGETSAPSYNRVTAYVLKKDNGRRSLRFIAVRSSSRAKTPPRSGPASSSGSVA